MNAQSPLPFQTSLQSIEPSWIDYNGHLNMAYYLVLFDRATDEFWDTIGLGENYQAKTNCTTYTASCKIDYIKEVLGSAKTYTKLVLKELGAKKFITWQGLFTDDNVLRASAETLSLHVNQSGEHPKVSPLPASIIETLKSIANTHDSIEIPALTGRPIEMDRPQNAPEE